MALVTVKSVSHYFTPDDSNFLIKKPSIPTGAAERGSVGPSCWCNRVYVIHSVGATEKSLCHAGSAVLPYC
jgi:hypothetical protein